MWTECRVCLNRRGVISLFSLPENYSINDLPAQMLSYVTQCEIYKGDGLPEGICKLCLEKVISAYEFKLQCIKSETNFKQHLKKICFKLISFIPAEFIDNKSTVLIVLPETTLFENLSHESLVKNVLENNKCLHPKSNLTGLLINCDFNWFQENFEKDKDSCKIESLVKVKNYIPSNTAPLKDENIKKFIFECTICKNTFTDRHSLKVHRKEHCKTLKHICKICLRSFKKFTSLKKHLFFHHNTKSALKLALTNLKKYKCTTCHETFNCKYLLFNHRKLIHHESKISYDGKNNLVPNKILRSTFDNNADDKKLNCSSFNVEYSNIIEFNHCKTLHANGNRFFCGICKQSYLKLSTLKLHLISHKEKEPYLCTICGKSFYNSSILKTHMIFHSDKLHICRFCDTKFHMRHKLTEHIRLNHSNERYNLICEICGKLCSSHRRLENHKSTHYIKSCPICEKKYRNIRCYKEHLKSHSEYPLNKKLFFCDYCGESKSSKTLLELHILSKHLKERRYKCKICGRGFFCKGALNGHEMVHTKIKIKCSICNKLFLYKKSLILHMRLHTGEKPYPCKMCGEKFLSSSRRIAHQKSKHGERTEHCQLCPSKFFQRSDLNKHMMVHSRKSKKLQINAYTNNVTFNSV